MLKNKKGKTNESEKIAFNVKKAKVKKEPKVKKKKKYLLKKMIESIKKNRKYYILSLIAIAFIALVIVLNILINRFVINKKYSKFEEKMDTYGFSLLYNNESSKSYEKVTNLEGVKLVLGTVYNTYDASYIGYQPLEEYDGDEWVRTAVAFGILEEGKITKENVNDNISYWDFIKMFLNARNKELELTISSTTECNIKNLYSFTQEQQQYINDLAENGLINNTKQKLNLDKDIIKGQINEIVINYVDKYNSLVDEGETLVLKEDSKPANKDYYPYIVYSIPNEVYEIKHVGQDDPNYMSPKAVYKYKKEYYNQMKKRLTDYYDTILNVNYKNINKEEFKNVLDELLLYAYDDSIFEEYVNYIKENEIVLVGSSKALLPIMYYDGIDFRLRMKLEFKIVSSKTDKNVVFGDLFNNSVTPVTYKEKEYSVYVDAPMSSLLNVISYRTEITSIINILSDKSGVSENAF